MWSAELSYGDTVLTIGDGSTRGGGYNATADGIEGWYETPDSKWDLTEKSYGHGAYGLVEEDAIVYSARTVTLNLYAEGRTRNEVVENAIALLGCAGHECTLTVTDGDYRSYVTGYATVEEEAGRISDARDEMALTLTCPDPYRYGCWLGLEGEVLILNTGSMEFEDLSGGLEVSLGTYVSRLAVTFTEEDGTETSVEVGPLSLEEQPYSIDTSGVTSTTNVTVSWTAESSGSAVSDSPVTANL